MLMFDLLSLDMTLGQIVINHGKQVPQSLGV